MKIGSLINKVYVTKDEKDQFNVEVFEDNFTDDYDSAELSVPEERDADEYIYSEQKQQNPTVQRPYEDLSGSIRHSNIKDGSYGKL